MSFTDSSIRQSVCEESFPLPRNRRGVQKAALPFEAVRVNSPSTIPPQRAESFQRHMAAHMKKQTGETLQEAARATGTAKSSILQFRWLDAPRSIGTARSAQAPEFESPVAAGSKADALEHGGMGSNEIFQQVLQRAILAEQKASLLEASLKDMTAHRDKWVLQADDWKEQAQHALRLLKAPE